MTNIIKRLTAFLLTLALLAVLVGCGDDKTPTESSTPGVSSAAGSVSSVPEPASSPEESSSAATDGVTFADLPAINTELIYLHACGDNILLECVNPGLDSSDYTVISYSLTQDKTLGTVALGEGAYSVKPNNNGGFAVFNLNDNKTVEYSPTCEKQSETTLAGFTGIGGLSVDADNRRLLLSVGSELYISSYDGKDKVKVDIPESSYTPLGCANGKFVFTQQLGSQLFAVGADGKATKLAVEVSAQYVNNSFVAARTRDYITLFSLSGGENMFIKVADKDELLCGLGNNAFVTATTAYEQSIIRVYNTSKIVCASTAVKGEVAGAAVTDSGLLITAVKGENGIKINSCKVSDLEAKSFTFTSDFSEVLSARKLPEITGSAELTALTNEILEKYNIRFVCGESWLSEEVTSDEFSFTFKDDDAAYLASMRLMIDCFDFLPDTVWKNIGGNLPFVVCLCDGINGSVDGLSIMVETYNVIFIECTGADWLIKNVFIHEVGHAIGKVVLDSRPELLEKWLECTPKKARDAVEKGTVDGVNSITIEYTPYDKNGEIYYVTSYALTTPEEDRAETLANLYTDCFAGKKVALFEHEVIKKKGRLWAEIIRIGFNINDELSFEKYLK